MCSVNGADVSPVSSSNIYRPLWKGEKISKNIILKINEKKTSFLWRQQ